jgi:hypothetical protein
MKLLAKTAEERYQTAGGVERDLRHCLPNGKPEAASMTSHLVNRTHPTGC